MNKEHLEEENERPVRFKYKSRLKAEKNFWKTKPKLSLEDQQMKKEERENR